MSKKTQKTIFRRNKSKKPNFRRNKTKLTKFKRNKTKKNYSNGGGRINDLFKKTYNYLKKKFPWWSKEKLEETSEELIFREKFEGLQLEYNINPEKKKDKPNIHDILNEDEELLILVLNSIIFMLFYTSYFNKEKMTKFLEDETNQKKKILQLLNDSNQNDNDIIITFMNTNVYYISWNNDKPNNIESLKDYLKTTISEDEKNLKLLKAKKLQHKNDIENFFKNNYSTWYEEENYKKTYFIEIYNYLQKNYNGFGQTLTLLRYIDNLQKELFAQIYAKCFTNEIYNYNHKTQQIDYFIEKKLITICHELREWKTIVDANLSTLKKNKQLFKFFVELYKQPVKISSTQLKEKSYENKLSRISQKLLETKKSSSSSTNGEEDDVMQNLRV